MEKRERRVDTSASRRALHVLMIVPLLLVGCDPQGYIPCPTLPASSGIPVPRSTDSTIDFELSGAYVAELIRAKLDTSGTAAAPTPSPSPSPTGDTNLGLVLDGIVTGADILRVTLDQKTVGGEKQSLVGITFVPWLMKKPKPASPAAISPPPSASPAPVRIGGPYTLTLKLAPKRAQQNGPISLAFEFVELNDGVTKVACSSAVPLDIGHLGAIKDVQVLTFIYGALGSLAIPLPDQAINDAVSKIGIGGGQIQGLAWSTDGGLKLGLLFGGAKHQFDDIATTTTSLAAGQDWAIDLDVSLITRLIRERVGKKLTDDHPGTVVLPEDIRVGYEREGLVIDLKGVSSGCGFTVNTVAKVQMVRDPSSGKSLLQIVVGTATPHVEGLGCQFLAFLTTFFSGGSATATIWSPLALPPCNGEQTIAVIGFDLEKDTLDGTIVNTNGGFLLAGRSALMTASLAKRGVTRPAAPPPCAL